MKRTLFFLVLLLCLLAPIIVLAAPPPPAGGGGGAGGGSPEPLSALLIAIGAVPTYLVYRRFRRPTDNSESPTE